MMTFEAWLDCVLDAARNISSLEFQRKAWFPGGSEVSSPEETYQVLMEDCTADLFFETYGRRFTEEQMRSWFRLRSSLEGYYDKLSAHPDPNQVLYDPNWDLVRQSAEEFVRAFVPYKA